MTPFCTSCQRFMRRTSTRPLIVTSAGPIWRGIKFTCTCGATVVAEYDHNPFIPADSPLPESVLLPLRRQHFPNFYMEKN